MSIFDGKTSYLLVSDQILESIMHVSHPVNYLHRKTEISVEEVEGCLCKEKRTRGSRLLTINLEQTQGGHMPVSIGQRPPKV